MRTRALLAETRSRPKSQLDKRSTKIVKSQRKSSANDLESLRRQVTPNLQQPTEHEGDLDLNWTPTPSAFPRHDIRSTEKPFVYSAEGAPKDEATLPSPRLLFRSAQDQSQAGWDAQSWRDIH